jgi:hypothetical protein
MPTKLQSVTEEKSESDSPLPKKRYALVSKKAGGNVTKVQSQVLETVVNYSRGAHFLSLRDLGRLIPQQTKKIDHSVAYLRNQGLIKTVEADGIIHYCSSEELKRLRKKMRDIVLDDRIEREIVQTVREFLQQLYPDALKIERVHPVGLHESRRFDIILEFKAPIMSKQFIIVDVYTKIPVTKYIVQSFIRKIKWTRNETKFSDNETRNSCYGLRGKTLGMIICNNASQEAVSVAREYNISLLRLSEIHIDYNRIRKSLRQHPHNVIERCQNHGPG